MSCPTEDTVSCYGLPALEHPMEITKGGRSRWKHAVFTILASVISCVLILAGIEVTLRLFVNQVFTARTDSPLVRSDFPDLQYQLAANYVGAGVQTDMYGPVPGLQCRASYGYECSCSETR